MKPLILMILDGYGLSENERGNAIRAAKTPVLDSLISTYPFVRGNASGLAVGLPDGQMGNSEVGHLNMGAGRVVYQDLTKITKSIEDGDFFQKEELLGAINNCKVNNSNLHLYGLLSDGGVHSDISHLYALLKLCKENNFDRVFVHCFMDGRDTSPTSGINFVKSLQDKIEKIGVGQIATIMGRYYAMDRDNRWERISRAYFALTKGEGNLFDDPIKAIEESYSNNVTDEFIEPIVITKNNKPLTLISDNDSIIFYNFRPDRAREISKCFCFDEFDFFDRGNKINTYYVCFTEIDVTISAKHVVFKEEEISNTFGKYISDKGLKQARIAETEKYAHVTFFFNGGVEAPNLNEDRFLIPSPKVATYDLEPKMSAQAVCEKLIEVINAAEHDVIIINFANPDMVGHTGNFDATKEAIEFIDSCVGRVVDVINDNDCIMFLCADHGNAEELVNLETGESWTAHTTNQVPFILINGPKGKTLRDGGRLCDIAPTLLELLDIEKPKEMTGESLLINI